MFNYCIIRYAEIALKGLNRPFFERKLIENIRNCLEKKKVKFENIKRIRGRILVKSENAKEVCECLKNIFGVASLSVAIKTEKVNETALKLFKNEKTFRITTQRIDKNFPKTSQQINEEVGAYVVKTLMKKVNLTRPELEIGIEIIDGEFYLFKEKIKGLSGLPVSVSGKVIVLIENENSLKAAELMMKRGCSVKLIGKKKFDLKSLKKFGDFDLEIVKKYKEIDKIAERENALALVVGQTLKNVKDLDTKLMILRPMVGF